MTFQQLRYLLEVHRTGSISKAAENLFVSRPAISLSISSLETELGYPLFLRTQNGLIPSPQGQLVLKYANTICDAQENIQNLNHETTKMIKLSIIRYAPVNKALVQLLDEYKDQQDITFSLAANTGVPIKDVALSRVDFAISARVDQDLPNIDKQILQWGLKKTELGKIPIVICIGPGHKFYDKTNLSINDFKNETLLDTVNRAWSTSGLIQKHLGIRPDNVISHKHNPGLKYSILAAGLAYNITRLPSEEDISFHKLRCIPIPDFYQRLISITDPRKPQSQIVERFSQILKEKLRQDANFIETN